jgi:hypothetical protein
VAEIEAPLGKIETLEAPFANKLFFQATDTIPIVLHVVLHAIWALDGNSQFQDIGLHESIKRESSREPPIPASCEKTFPLPHVSGPMRKFLNGPIHVLSDALGHLIEEMQCFAVCDQMYSPEATKVAQDLIGNLPRIGRLCTSGMVPLTGIIGL